MTPKSTSKLSVALVFDDTLDSNDGVSQQVKLLGSWLSARGHKVSYIVGETKLTEWRGGKVYSLATNIGVRFNGNRLSMPLWSSGRKIKLALEKIQPDVVHVMAPYSPLMSQKIIRLCNKPVVVIGSFHILPLGLLSSVGARLLSLWQWRSLKRFDAFSATSPNAAKFAKKTMRINAQVIPNTIDVAKLSNNTRPAKDRIVFLGRLVKRKGCQQLIEAFSILVKTHAEAELVIAGDGMQRPMLERLVQKKGLSDKVKFLGFIDEADKPNVLGSATIACFPSLGGESFGVVLIEAMAAGSDVVIGGNNPGYQSVLGAHPELMFDPNDAQKLANKLRQFLESKTFVDEIHKWQEQEVSRYDINVVGEEFERLYNSLIADKHRAEA